MSGLLDLHRDVATAWTASFSSALAALRLNQQFPPWARLAAHVRAMVDPGGGARVRVDRASGLPAPREWMRVRAERELVARDPAGARPDRVRELLDVDPLPARDVHVALRGVDGDRASYLVRVDRFDVASGLVARYTLVLWDAPGARMTPGELEIRASEAFRGHLELLSTQDAALAFAVLREREGVDVEEVVRGVVGPAVLPAGWVPGDPGCGPEDLRPLALGGPALSACLERASLDVDKGRIDDPLARTVVVPGEGETFGMSRQRKWAAPTAGVDVLKGWLSDQGSRNLVYAAATARPPAA